MGKLPYLRMALLLMILSIQKDKANRRFFKLLYGKQKIKKETNPCVMT
ncbi:hypothetical protein B4096_1652 [Heyndrickxia coagulans]|nr:hypothetical protein B4096_1652 [Heyndrickxia coagulans]